MFALLRHKKSCTHELMGIPMRTDRCKICDGLVLTGVHSNHLGGWVDLLCIPAIVRRRGPDAVTRWLETGDHE
jgi:hypothetical protein